MNTLSRAITARFFPNPNSYNAFRKHWSALINSERKHELSAAHHLLYLALIGKDWRKAFTPLTNQRKLDNGAFWDWGMFRALQTIQLKFKEEELLTPFEGLITPQMLSEIRSLLPTPSAYTCKPSDFTNGPFPFEAYSEKKDVTAIVRLRKEEPHE
jgi:hypothetical protein